MNFTTITFEKKDTIGIIRLNRPERMNAVNEAMYTEIQKVLKSTKSKNDVRVLIITGSVLKRGKVPKQAFCAGADLKEHSAGKRNKSQRRKYIELAHETTRLLYEYPKPVIAAINGAARGAGVEMALNCDFIFMAHDATLAFTETGLGTFVGGGVTSHLPVMLGITRAKELIYTGRVVDGKEAYKMGIALRSVTVKQLLPHAVSFAKELSEKAPHSMTLAKKRLQNARLFDIKTVLKHETEAILSCMETEDWHEGISAFMEKRKPVYKGR
jgi:enoyl-CoA hydratase